MIIRQALDCGSWMEDNRLGFIIINTDTPKLTMLKNSSENKSICENYSTLECRFTTDFLYKEQE